MTIHNSNYSDLLSAVGSTFNGMEVQQRCGEMSSFYLQRIESTLDKALECHPRTMAVRVDLRFPKVPSRTDDAVISRFFASLKAQITADLKSKELDGKRVHSCRLRYVWAREQDSSIHQHYHVLLLVNSDTYNCLGRYQAESGNLACRIRTAWASAIGVSVCSLGGSVHFPENPIYHVKRNCTNFSEAYRALFYRVSYFAKLTTKPYGCHVRHFGCSQG